MIGNASGADAWIGYAAAVLTTSSLFPQAWLIWRRRDVSGISLGMYTAFTVGVGLWLAYGLRMGDWPIILANAVTLTQAVAILTMKVVLDRRPRRP